MAEYQTGPMFKQPPFNSNICFNYTNRNSRLHLNHSQEPGDWVDADLGFLWVESEQKLHLKVGCSNFSPVRDLDVYLIYLTTYLTVPQTRIGSQWVFHLMVWVNNSHMVASTSTVPCNFPTQVTESLVSDVVR